MSGMINLNQATEEMKRHNLRGLLICSPENFIYAAGYTPMLLDLYRLSPLSLCFLPLDESLPKTLIVPETDATQARIASGFDNILTFPVWWEVYQIEKHQNSESFYQYLSKEHRPLPEQYNVREIARITAGLLTQLGLEKARIGIELSFVSNSVFSLFSTACPEITFIDSTALLYKLRSVKNQSEIEHLKNACAVTEAGIFASSRAIQPGVSIGELSAAFQKGVLEAARENQLLDLLGSVGGQPALGAACANSFNRIQTFISTTVKYDMQVSVAHYHSDVGRTYLCGQATKEQSRLYKALLGTHQRLLDAIQPGLPISAIYNTAREYLDQIGFNRLSRGHFGHSVGLDTKIEEPPFISATETEILRPGMVLAIETPCYFEGIGKYQIEDMILITADGWQSMNTLSKDW